MSDINEIKDGFNAGYILKTKSPETYKLLEGSLKEVDLPFFNAFIDGGRLNKRSQIKDKGLESGIEY